jgi:hypothetical protein
MKTNVLILSAGLAFLLMWTGCAVNQQVAYNNILTGIEASSGYTYLVATHDQREEVLDGSRKEDYVGYFRSTVAIAYPIGTVSGKNFSDDFSASVVGSLIGSGYSAQYLLTRAADSKETILANLLASTCDRKLLFTVTKWRTDSKPIDMMYGTDFIWDLQVEIYNKEGELLASNSTEGIDPGMDLALAGSTKRVQKIANSEFIDKIHKVLSSPEVKEALGAKY